MPEPHPAPPVSGRPAPTGGAGRVVPDDRFFDAEPGAPPVPLVDAHVHLGPSDSDSVFYPTLSGPEYAAVMEATPVARAIAFAPLRTDGYARANRDLLAWCETTGGRVRPLARLGGAAVPVTEPELWLARRAVTARLRKRPPDLDSLDDLGRYAGVKLLPHLDGLPDAAAFDRVAALGLPVLVHGGKYSPPSLVERAILPRVRGPVVLAHLGSFPAEERMLHEAVDLARREPRVFLDTSGVVTAAFLRYAAERVPHKLLFGSDAPLMHPGVAWAHVASVVPRAHWEAIASQTAQTVFGLDA